MELEESGHQCCHNRIKDERDHNHDVIRQLRVITRKEFVIEPPQDGLVKVISHREDCRVSDQEHIYQQENEVLPVPEADAVINPWAVVVHVEHTSITG
jgi:hypothetical protein